MEEVEIRDLAQIDYVELSQNLDRAGFTFRNEVLQIDQMFDTPSATLFRDGSKVRIRITAPDSAELTYKSSMKKSQEVSVRDEINIALKVSDVPRMGMFLSSLGFPPLFTLPKRRKEFVRGDAKVHIDELPILGTVIEIEGSLSELQSLRVEVAPTLHFANYRLSELTARVMSIQRKTFQELKEAAEAAWGMTFGNIELALGITKVDQYE